MPRVRIKKKEYMVSDLVKWINRRRADLNLRQNDLAKLLGISQPALSNRLEKGLFDYTDMIKIFKVLNATDEEILKLMKM